ncbi:hypothetical protein KSS87_008772 [Heliosperma pusillum]|nr:hypothetical protein KSS87_008772 [Heliosperma pusillum]
MLANSSTSLRSEQSLSLVSGSNMVNVASPSCTVPRQNNSYQGPVAILWDIENCPVPSDVRPEDVAGNIRMALRVHPVIQGVVTLFSAYGDFNAFPRRLREGCQRTGVKLVDVPNGRKDAADKAILVDMFLFALDNPPPSSIMLISGDVDFAPALHILGQRGYTVILVIPAGVGVSSALCNAGRFVWDWPSVARGEGFVPPARPLIGHRGGVNDGGLFMNFHIGENADGNDEEAIVYRGLESYYGPRRSITVVSQELAEYTNYNSVDLPVYNATIRSHSLPFGLNEVTACPESSAEAIDHNDPVWWVQAGDLNGLKSQLVKVLELSGGSLPLARIPGEYQKVFGRPLCMSDYGAFKLVNLLKKMSDALVVGGKGQKKSVYLRNAKAGPSVQLLPIKKDKKGKEVQEQNVDGNAIYGSSDEFSDEERVVVEEQEARRVALKQNLNARTLFEIHDQILEQFKNELEEMLVSYSCRIDLHSFESIYQQRYKKAFDYQKFGVHELEALFEKVKDIAYVHEDPVTKRKFITSALG